MNLPRAADVVVIDGGPTGSSAATFLRQKGYDVVILEKERHPRYAVGESIIPHFWKYCEALGVTSAIEHEGFLRKAGGTVVWNGVIRQMSFGAFGCARPAMHVERDRLDFLLLEHAKTHGTPVFEEVSVSHVDLSPDKGPMVRYRAVGENEGGEIQAKYVLDASGQSGVLARQLGVREIDDAFRFIGLWGYFDNARYFGIDGKAHQFFELRETPPTTFVSNLEGWGWLWHIPLRASTSVGLILPVEALKDIKSQEALSGNFERRCRETPYLGRLLEGATYQGHLRAIRDYSYRPTRSVGPGYYLLGDAAGFVDPIFSVGVPLGMFSAYLAAWALDRTFQDQSKGSRLQAFYEQQFQQRLEMSRALSLPCYAPPDSATDTVRHALQFESSIEQELIHVVTNMTTRGANFDAINDGRPIASNKYRVVDELAFD